jgi:signal transduction histidine kinase
MKEFWRRLDAGLPWLAVVALASWARWAEVGLLGLAAGFTVAALIRNRQGPVARSLGLLVLLLGVVGGFQVENRDRQLTISWEDYWADQEAGVIEDLGRRLDQLLDRSITNVGTLADETGSGNLPGSGRVEALRRGAGLAALSVYGPDGVPRVWDGMHRGRVPDEVKLGEQPFFFGQSPLFSYLYVTAPVTDGGTAVGAVLLRADLPGQAGDIDDLASSFRLRTGETLRLSTPDRAREGGIFDYMHEGQALFSLAVERPAQAERRGDLLRSGAGWVALSAALAWLILAVSVGPTAGSRSITLASGLLLAVLTPVDASPGLALVDAPGDLLLPFVPGGTLARLLLVCGVLAVGAGLLRFERGPRLGPLPAAFLVALFAPLFARALQGAASVGFLSGGEGGWVAYQVALASGCSLLIWLGLAAARGVSDQRRRVVAALVVTTALASGTAWWVIRSGALPPWVPALWALPLALAIGPSAARTRPRRFASWVVAGCLGASLAIPVAWGHRLEARIAGASAQVDRMGTDVDPYLQFLLERLATEMERLDEGGAPPAELLYRGWRDSGMAESGYPLWMTLWTPGGDLWEEELRIGMGGVDRPVIANQFLESARAGDSVEVRRFDSFEAHYMVQVPLRDARVVTAVVPPLGTTGAESLLGPLFGSLGPTPGDPVRLVPVGPGESADLDNGIRWVRRAGLWRGELPIVIAGEEYQANYEVPLPALTVLAARGALLLVLDLALLGLLWWFGAWLADRRTVGGGGALWAVRSFRARVTLALFAFFALSNLIFGSLAYRTIAGASQRASRVLAERAVNDAAASYFDLFGNVDLLANRVGVDVLEYRDGELREGSVEELVSLGLYEGWVPFPVFQTLMAREAVSQTIATAVGGWEYVTAYRRLPDGDIVAAPVPLQAGATAIQSRDVAQLLSAAVLAGAALSFLLALLVGRALTRPIQTLRIASERVGSGNLEVRLPEERHDEFGAVFEAFNRMVRRLHTARDDLVRTSRRTQAIVEDAATGVLAFDADGVVTLANPTARSLLDLPIEVGSTLPATDGPAGGFVSWIDHYLRDGLAEGGLELQRGDRRIRVRARRISHAGPMAGAVVSLEDVTDELRTERVLAWGEMARQVAHEVKNPLTPIKLSVQHLRRAWIDGRPDFGDILTRNVEAMLLEIDRLAAIASSFSRFGAPMAAGEEPLARVQLGSVVRQVLALYGDGDGAIRFEDALEPGLPAVLARDSEVKEVLVNLLENARAAVRSGGVVRVEGAAEELGVVLRVVDDGVGIPEAFLGRVFEPHFSTRSAGTGLGLAIVHRLVGSWGASVRVDSREGEGTVVSIHFEVARAPDGAGSAT